MTVGLDAPVVARGVTVAAICRTELAALRFGCLGAKRPLALLVREADGVRAFAPDGREMSAAEVEHLCPGALARFSERASAPPT